MREIEIKAKVKSLTDLEKQIIKFGVKLGKKLKQHDVVYALPGSEDNHLKAVWLRIRTENDIRFTLVKTFRCGASRQYRARSCG